MASMHVLKMPCCVCSATLCLRTDGSPIVVFEHKEQQPTWFGKTQSIMTRCFDKQCQVVEMAKHLAATWRHGDRHLTIIGAEGLARSDAPGGSPSTSKEPAERPKDI